MVRICVIEDSSDIQQIIRMHLDPWYQVTIASSLQEARTLLETKTFDMFLLDVDLPDGNGFEFCASLRADRKTRQVPVIFLTGKNEPLDKFMGFKLGGDDYIVKPFEPLEVRARIEARLRKVPAAAPLAENEIIAGPLRFDCLKQRVYTRHGASEQDIGLTPLEYKLLHFIVVHPGQVFNRVQLMKNILEPGVHVNEENIYTHVCAVRRKLGIYASLLECIPRVGYRFAGTSTGGGQTSAA